MMLFQRMVTGEWLHYPLPFLLVSSGRQGLLLREPDQLLIFRMLPDRSPSPPPQYDNFGRRVNTREYRYRKRLEDERHKLIEKAMRVIPNYHPPSDYRRPTKTQEKVYVPVNDYPEINFSMITNPGFLPL